MTNKIQSCFDILVGNEDQNWQPGCLFRNYHQVKVKSLDKSCYSWKPQPQGESLYLILKFKLIWKLELNRYKNIRYWIPVSSRSLIFETVPGPKLQNSILNLEIFPSRLSSLLTDCWVDIILVIYLPTGTYNHIDKDTIMGLFKSPYKISKWVTVSAPLVF